MSTLPEGCTTPSTGAAIRVHPSGDFLYTSVRGHNSVAAFSLDQVTGRVHAIQHIDSGGRCPRDFDIDPSGKFIYCCNQDSDVVTIFHIDTDAVSDAHLRPADHVVKVPAPVCVLFIPRESHE